MASSSTSIVERKPVKLSIISPIISSSNSLKRAHDQRRTIHRSGILPCRSRPHVYKPPSPKIPESFNLLDQSTLSDELICRFFLSNGLSYETAEDEEFKALMKLMNPNIVIPTFPVIEACVERLAFPVKPHINFQKTVGPLTSTIGLYRHCDEVFLAFSIHYFEEDGASRKTAIYLRKMILCEVDGEHIMQCVRKVVNNFNYSNVKFTNVLAIDEAICQKLCQSNAITNSFVCFFTYLSRFVEDVIRIDEFHKGLATLRAFIIFIRRHYDLYSKFRRQQLTKNADLDLPGLDSAKWISTYDFLSECLSLHPTFLEFSSRWHLTTYISNDMFIKLSYLHNLLGYAKKIGSDLSLPDSSISQVIPSVVSIKSFIESISKSCEFSKEVFEKFHKHLAPLTNGFDGRKYDFASLLDPRYAYRESLYDLTTWCDIENDLKAVFAHEKMMFNDKNPSEMIILSNPAKFIRLAKVEDEIKLYRTTISSVRPLQTTDPFVWWGYRMREMSNLYNKARECLALPAISIDAEHYFGRSGKYSYLCTRLNYQQLEHALMVAAQHESFLARGYVRSISSNKKRAVASESVDMPILKNETDTGSDAFLENMLMIPPTEKKRKTESESLPDAEVEIKKEPEDSIIECGKEEMHESKILDDIKQEILDDIVEVKPEPFLSLKGGDELSVSQSFEDQSSSSSSPVSTGSINRVVRRYPVAIESTPPIWIPLSKRSLAIPSSAGNNGTSLPPAPVISKPQRQKSESSVNEEKLMDLVKKRQFNRRCSVCLKVEGHTNLKNVTIANEKMMILTGLVAEKKLDPSQARYCFTKEAKTYICRRHFGEACTYVFRALNVTSPDQVFSVRQDTMKSVLDIIEEIKGAAIGSLQFKQMFITFSEKYYKNNKEKFRDNASKDLLLTPKCDILNVLESQESSKPGCILPKALRQPRKQILEKDNEELVVRRIIQYKPWQTKRSPDTESVDRFKNPFRCCFCQNLCERGDMVKVPNSEERRECWYQKLGKEFEAKVKSVEENFICRAHFQHNAFSSRGRLRKGMLPCTPEEIVTFKLKGDNFEPIDNEAYEETSDSDDEIPNLTCAS